MTSSHQNPDERGLLDFADAVVAGQNPQPRTDEERTYLHVHNAMQGESAAIPSTTKQSTWEDVMSTLALTPEAPVSNRTRKQQGLSSPPRVTRPRRMQWTPLASVAAAVLVVIASFGVWFTSGNETTPPPVEPRHVAGLAPGELQQIATPESTYTCDFTQDMPIVQTGKQQPFEGTHLVWQEGGDLILRCDEEPEDVVLATGISQAGPVEGIPGLATVYYPEDDTTELAMGQSQYINITTGDSYTAYNAYNSDPGFFQQAWGDYRSGPFLFVHNEDAILVLLDTRSMTAMPVGELFGEGAPQSFNLLQHLSDDGSTMALMLGDQEAANSGAHPMPALTATETGADGDILLLNMETGETNWLTMPAIENEILTGVNLSPDASLLAVTLAPATEGMMANDARVMIVSTEDGTILNESETFASFDMQSLWTESGLVVQANQDILLIPTNGEEVSVLYSLEDSATTMQGLLPTLDPNVIVATSIICQGECRMADADVNVVAINVATGETDTFSGQNIAAMTWAETATLLLMTDPSVTSPDTTTYTVIDPVSGEVVAEFEGIPGMGVVERQMSLIGAKSIGVSGDDQTLVVAIGMQYIIELKSDGTEHSARLLPAPGRWAEEGSGNPTASIFLSPDGTQLSAMAHGDEAQTRFMLDLTDPEAEWVTVETTRPGSGGYILFVEGVPQD